VSQQIVETEHLFKALLEQPNGLARRILAKAGSNPTDLLEKTDTFIRRQPRVTGDSQQARLPGRMCSIACPCMPFYGPTALHVGHFHSVLHCVSEIVRLYSCAW